MASAEPFTIEVESRSYLIRTTPVGFALEDGSTIAISLNVEAAPRRGRRFCRRAKALRERGICPCRHMYEHAHRVFTFDDWGLGPQCVECGRLKGVR